VLFSIFCELQRQVFESDFWNDELDEEDRKRIYDAWADRCRGNPEEASRGLRRVDFLCEGVFFLGLKKRGDDEWEMKIKEHPSVR